MEIGFDFRLEKSSILGPVLRPVAEVTFINNGKEILESVYVDSGADITLVSKSVGEILGFIIEEKDEITKIKGIGETSIPIIIKKMRIRIGEKLLETRIAWALIEDVPLLLGRTDIFNFFEICFKKSNKTVFSD